jgi:hypothetical protein
VQSWVRVSLGLVLVAAPAACTSERTPAAGSSSPAAVGTPSQQADSVPGHEVRATSETLEAWALLYQASPWASGQEVKVVWRSTGAGHFDVVAVGPASQQVKPTVGPEAHASSNWIKPGEEWGTFFRLDEPGKWVLRVKRGSDTASVPITVTAA